MATAQPTRFSAPMWLDTRYSMKVFALSSPLICHSARLTCCQIGGIWFHVKHRVPYGQFTQIKPCVYAVSARTFRNYLEYFGMNGRSVYIVEGRLRKDLRKAINANNRAAKKFLRYQQMTQDWYERELKRKVKI